MIDLSSLFSPFQSLQSQDIVFSCLGVFLSGILANVLITLYTQKNKCVLGGLKQIFFSFALLICWGFCIFDFFFVVAMYHFTPYALFVGIVLFLLFVMSYIDWIILAIPDWLNFFCFLFIFIGLYELSLLQEWQIIASFCVAGGLSLLRIFGNFVFQKEILGEADLVVFASMGALMGIERSLDLLLLASCLAMGYILLFNLFSFKDRQILLSTLKVPFVPFLFLAFVGMLGYSHWIEQYNV